MKTLSVYLQAVRAGSLKQDEYGRLQFHYDQTWLEKPGAAPLSRSLPLQSAVFTSRQARPFFAGLLPEAELRRQIARILGISADNDFALLEKLGGECAGAVTLLPTGVAIPAQKRTGLHDLSEPELQHIVAELPRRPLLAGMEGLRLSLAGAQDKLPVIVHNGRIGLPLGNAPSTHVLKPEPDRFPGLAANETFCLALARAVGLKVPESEYRLIGDKPCLLVKRYDRKPDENGSTLRIHQEDFCQALGFPPERKYQSEGGPGLRDCIAQLREWSTAPVLDIPQFIDGLIFNVLIGNTDAHGKNFSLLYSGGERRLSPFYDLVSTLAWPELSRKLAMKIGPCESVEAFTPGDWKTMARQTGLGWPRIRERLTALSRAVLGKLDTVLVQTREYTGGTAKQLQETIGARSDRMLTAVAAP